MAKLLTIPLAIIALLGLIGFYRLPTGWVIPSINAVLTDTVGPVQVTIPKAQMRWGGWRHPLGINVRNVIIKKADTDITLEIPSLLFSIKLIPLLWGKAEIGRCYFESSKLYTHDQLIGQVGAKVKMRRHRLSIKVDFKQLDATSLSHLYLGKKTIPRSPFLIQGTMYFEGNHSSEIKKFNLIIQSQGGSIIIPEIYPVPLKLDQAELALTGNDKSITLTKFEIQQGNAKLKMKGSLKSPAPWYSLYTNGGLLELLVDGMCEFVPVDDLKQIWPHGLSRKPRHWVVNRLSKGIADKAEAHMKGVIHLAPKGNVTKFEVPKIEGQIDASDVTVDYFGKLPPVKQVSGKCVFTREKFKISAVGIANDVLLKSAQITIHDLHLQDQSIDIDLDLEGAVGKSLEIINSEPLFLAKKLDIDPRSVNGQALTKVHLAFPLETDVPLELVNVNAQSKIAEGKIVYNTKLDGKSVIIDRGTFDLNVSRKSLELKGQGYLQDVLTQIQWQEYFEKKGIPFRRQFLLKGLLNLQNLSNFGLQLRDYLDGKVPTEVKYVLDQNYVGIIEGFADLTSAIMVSPILLWQKDKGEPADFKITLRKAPKQDQFKLEQASLTAPYLNVVMSGRASELGDQYDIHELKIGKTDLKSTAYFNKDRVLSANVWGKVLDLSHIIDDSSPDPLIKPTSDDDGEDTGVKVNLNLEEIQLGNNNAIHKVNGNMLYKGSRLTHASLKGKPPHKDGSISLHMHPLGQNKQQFTLESDDGGHLLEMLGAGYDLEGGHLVIKGIKTNHFEQKKGMPTNGDHPSWKVAGGITIDNFTINKAPILARLLAAASLQGVVNFFSGKGIHFHEGEAEFSLTPSMLQLTKVRLISPSLGLLLNGTIDRMHNKVNFVGELIPLYIVNTVLARIPLIGDWFSGGNEDGVFMTQFTLTGDRKDPDLMINPISTVTPGLVRELFTPEKP